MKTIVKFLIAAITLMVTIASSNAITLNMSSDRYLGSIDDGIPSNDANELNWVNELIDLVPGTSGPSTNPAGETLDRSSNDFGLLPDAISGSKIENGGARTVSSFLYALGKYGAGKDGIKISHVWYLGAYSGNDALAPDDMVDLDFDGTLSHTTMFRAAEVPDSGSTLALLGIVLSVCAFARRKINA